MKRRIFLGSLATIGTVGTLGGCLGLADPNPNVTLGEPDRQFDSSDVPYQAWGERVPDVTIPAPVDSRSVSLRTVDTPTVITFFFSHCMTICPVLISALRNVQTDAMNNGYANQVTFLPITFDPARDHAQRLQAYAEEMNIADGAGNWYFLRPDSEQSATQIIQKEFGVMFEKTPTKKQSGYMFTHTPLTLLVNADGYVERAYKTKSPAQETIIDDLAKLR
ncbi:SCO family protein [Halocatena marina]|uniref:SCO family protein n=1 Tax=Halocatena marina TaxID=2934937 RepID=A0ABD5YQ19_9EURY|nr:SCO family protein [Halocatena marina]